MRLSVVVALIAVIGLVAAPRLSTVLKAAPSEVEERAQNGIDGKWALLFDTPMGSLDAAATFKADGDALTGTMESQAGSTQFKGTIKGNTINFVLNVQTPQGDMSVQLNAEVEGDSLKGTFDFGQGTGNWTGKRVKN